LARQIFAEVDADNSGLIDADELLVIFAKRASDPSTLNDEETKAMSAQMVSEWGTDGELNDSQFYKLLDDNAFWPLMSAWGDDLKHRDGAEPGSSRAQSASPVSPGSWRQARSGEKWRTDINKGHVQGALQMSKAALEARMSNFGRQGSDEQSPTSLRIPGGLSCYIKPVKPTMSPRSSSAARQDKPRSPNPSRPQVEPRSPRAVRIPGGLSCYVQPIKSETSDTAWTTKQSENFFELSADALEPHIRRATSPGMRRGTNWRERLTDVHNEVDVDEKCPTMPASMERTASMSDAEE